MVASMTLKAGNLPHRIIVQALTKIQDPNTGRLTSIWSDFAKVWAKVDPLSTKDRLQAQAVNSNMTARCKIRYSSKTIQIDSTMRVLFRTKYWKIDGDPMPDNQSGLEWLTLNLAEGDKSWVT